MVIAGSPGWLPFVFFRIRLKSLTVLVIVGSRGVELHRRALPVRPESTGFMATLVPPHRQWVMSRQRLTDRDGEQVPLSGQPGEAGDLETAGLVSRRRTHTVTTPARMAAAMTKMPISYHGKGRDRLEVWSGAAPSWTVTLLVAGDNVTVPVPWSTRPAEVVAMLSMNCGSWKSTGPDGGWPRSVERHRPATR